MKNLVVLFSLVFFFGCKENTETTTSEEMMISLPKRESKANYDAVYESAAETVDSAVAVVEAAVVEESPNEEIEQKIIKSGDLRFETSNIEATHKTIQELVKKHKATVQNDSEGKDDYTIYRNLTLRIPNENFDAFITDVSTGVDYFDRKSVSIDDVTEEYIDVASRIKTKKALEERYLQLLKKANKVSEMLEIERELATIREEIEAKEGRLKYIQNKVSMSTINLEFYKTLEHKAGATVSFGTKFVNAIKSGFNGISSFFIWLIEVWPFIVILVAIIYFVKRRFKRKSK
ncbi:MAG: DUF4349 domain-containing protein [Flavobacterium sp.]|uniref:DUF4349 domain-containing protein n=1 Tax=Flavobacterium sp. TaxID=239 RepID=UPI0022CA3075|nr:DUF4349 domain-containing protein [Flavobacterium sp.]MCZ8196577.1 DUF4349 domain-containing protein [Flavobacterium sp.]